MYELVTNPEEGVEEPPPVHFGDMREKLGGEYIANVVGRPDGGAVVGVGTHRYIPRNSRIYSESETNRPAVEKALILCS